MYVIEKEFMFRAMLAMQLKEVNHSGNHHRAQYDPEFVFRLTRDADEKSGTTLNGCHVRLFSHRYQVFERSRQCVTCGVVGQVFCLDTKSPGARRAHFNLYGIMPSGRVVMLTKDHIIPKSKGGTNTLDNYQTMCQTCNQKKDDS